MHAVASSQVTGRTDQAATGRTRTRFLFGVFSSLFVVSSKYEVTLQPTPL
jgi:hypothetical protein